ncbi:MAG: hypothetical protein AB7I18_03250 [Candidatus Berkiella sp.]
MASTGPIKVKKASHEEIKQFIHDVARDKQAGEWTPVGSWEVGRGRKSGNAALANQQYHIELTRDGQLIYLDKTRNFEQIKKPKKLDSLLDDTTRQSISVWKDLVLLRNNALSIDMGVKARANGQDSRLNTKQKHDSVVTEFKELRQRLEKTNLLPVDIAILDRLASQS